MMTKRTVNCAFQFELEFGLVGLLLTVQNKNYIGDQMHIKHTGPSSVFIQYSTRNHNTYILCYTFRMFYFRVIRCHTNRNTSLTEHFQMQQGLNAKFLFRTNGNHKLINLRQVVLCEKYFILNVCFVCSFYVIRVTQVTYCYILGFRRCASCVIRCSSLVNCRSKIFDEKKLLSFCLHVHVHVCVT